jgi:hypothetical protein
MSPANGNNLDHEAVPPGCGCPSCHEADMDRLVWIDDETVECQTCKTRYNPMTGERHDATTQ